MKSTRFQFNPFLTRKATLLPVLALLSASGTSLHAQSTWGGTTGALTGATADSAHAWSGAATNWTGGIPNTIGATANVTNDFSGATSIFLNGAVTVGTLNLNDTGATSDVAITVAGGTGGTFGGTGTPSLTFDNTSGNAVLTSAGASNVISANMTFTDSVDLTTTNSLTLSGVISGAGTLNKLNAGTSSVSLNGDNTSWNGGIRHERGLINMGGVAANDVLGSGSFTFNNAMATGGTTLTVNSNVSRSYDNAFIQNNADDVTGIEYASITSNATGYRIQTFTGDFSTGASYYGGTATNTNGQGLALRATKDTPAVGDEGTFIFTGDWSGYDAVKNIISGGTTNGQAFRILSGGSYVFDKSASTHSSAVAGSAGTFQLSSTESTIATKLILSEDASTLKNVVQFQNASGQRHSLGLRAGSSTGAIASGAIAITGAPGANFFAQDATSKLTVSGLVSGSGAGGVEINKSYTFTSADLTNTTQTPTGIVELSRAAGNTYSGGTTVTAGTLLVSNTSNSGTGTGTVTVKSGATLGGGSGATGGRITGATVIESGGFQTAGTRATASSAIIGIQTFETGGIDYQAGSIFEWNLTASGGSEGTRGTNYDGVSATSFSNTGANAIFRVVLNGTEDFTSGFWDADKSWTNIFTNIAGTAQSLQDLFGTTVQTYNTAGLVDTTAQGSFTISGSALTWSAVPEPTSALAGLLIGAGLLRRRRTA